jgi:hypothetical protein
MTEERRVNSNRLVLWGAVAGLATCVVYPLIAFSPLPDRAKIILAALMGPLLGIASWGLRQFLILDRPRVAADLGALSNALAGVVLTAMFLVQAAIGMRIEGKPSLEAEAVWLGLDVAWDVYLGCGTLLLASSMFRHPRFGRAIAGAGALVALGLLVLNLATFPVPPGNAGLIDLGPVVGLWYLIVAVMVLRSLPWARQRAEVLWPDAQHAHAADGSQQTGG